MSHDRMSEELWRGCLLAAACIASQALAIGALAQQTNESRPPQSFATQAAVIGKAEIELGQLAAEKTQNQSVRDYAARMVTDHRAAAAKLQKIADHEKLQLPAALDAEHEALKTKLSGLQGAAFDKEYAKAMVKSQDHAVALFQAASQAAQMSSELKEFAASTLPALKEHDQMAHSLYAKEGG